MTKPTLVVMAAGLGSRYGGLKQMAPVDGANHILIDFSIYDAVRAGFDKLVCIIKPEMEQDFHETIGRRVAPFIDPALRLPADGNASGGLFGSAGPRQALGHRPRGAVRQGANPYPLCGHQRG